MGLSPSSPAELERLRTELGVSFPLLSDRDELAVSALCAGVAHCMIVTDPGGLVRWGSYTESWAEGPAPTAVFQYAWELSR